MLNKKILVMVIFFLIFILAIFIVCNNTILNDSKVYSDKNTKINSKVDESGSVLEKKARDMAESDFGADMPVLGFTSCFLP